jgi:hypothetical protein
MEVTRQGPRGGCGGYAGAQKIASMEKDDNGERRIRLRGGAGELDAGSGWEGCTISVHGVPL